MSCGTSNEVKPNENTTYKNDISMRKTEHRKAPIKHYNGK